MKRGVFAVLAVWCVALVFASGPHARSGPAEAGHYDSPIAPAQSSQPAAATASPHAALLTQYCLTCHNDRAKMGGLVLTAADLANIPAHADVWEKVIRK